MISLKTLKLSSRLDVEEISFMSGAINILIGPNGAGKSTLLDIISGNENFDSGSITLKAKNLDEFSIHGLAKEIAYVPQKLDWNGNLKVIDIILFSLYPHQKDAKIQSTDQIRLDKIIEELKIESFLERRFDELSGGEQKRVAIASALFQNTDIVILDEPFAALDPIYRKTVADFLMKWNQEYGTTMIFTVHDLYLAHYIGDYFWGLSQGRLEFKSTDLSEEALSTLFKTDFHTFERDGEKVFLPSLKERS